MEPAQKRNYPKIRNTEQPTLRPVQYGAVMINATGYCTSRSKHTQHKMRHGGRDEEGDLLPELHHIRHLNNKGSVIAAFVSQ